MSIEQLGIDKEHLKKSQEYRKERYKKIIEKAKESEYWDKPVLDTGWTIGEEIEEFVDDDIDMNSNRCENSGSLGRLSPEKMYKSLEEDLILEGIKTNNKRGPSGLSVNVLEKRFDDIGFEEAYGEDAVYFEDITSRGIIAKPSKSPRWITMYHRGDKNEWERVEERFKDKDIPWNYNNAVKGDDWVSGKVSSEEIGGFPEVKHVLLPNIKETTLFLVDNQELREADETFWQELDEKIDNNIKYLEKVLNPTDDDLKGVIQRYPRYFGIERNISKKIKNNVPTLEPLTREDFVKEDNSFIVKDKKHNKPVIVDLSKAKALHFLIEQENFNYSKDLNYQYRKLMKMFRKDYKENTESINKIESSSLPFHESGETGILWTYWIPWHDDPQDGRYYIINFEANDANARIEFDTGSFIVKKIIGDAFVRKEDGINIEWREDINRTQYTPSHNIGKNKFIKAGGMLPAEVFQMQRGKEDFRAQRFDL